MNTCIPVLDLCPIAKSSSQPEAKNRYDLGWRWWLMDYVQHPWMYKLWISDQRWLTSPFHLWSNTNQNTDLHEPLSVWRNMVSVMITEGRQRDVGTKNATIVFDSFQQWPMPTLLWSASPHFCKILKSLTKYLYHGPSLCLPIKQYFHDGQNSNCR